ncbi:MAG TPA: methyltransferase domain-containing protein [Rhodocyclaceae bacterium]|nr:methyltransferase domain-containing protein [Rhodocyclaceae bacterium]
MTAEKAPAVDFDDYADRYEPLLARQLAFFSADRGYFSDYKVRLLARVVSGTPGRILDFGCGIGLTLPYLAARFPASRLAATDISRRSLEYVARSHPGVEVVPDGELDSRRFDLVLAAGVFHHVPPALRPGVLARIAGFLIPGGSLCVFEHNPYNPVTRRLVATCPFDADARLLSRRHMAGLMGAAGLKPRRAGYCLFFPPGLAGLARLDPALAWLPLGGQYFVLGSR